jgi:sigma-B regulation protein RsbU (phosphoserine phosphatase)
VSPTPPLLPPASAAPESGRLQRLQHWLLNRWTGRVVLGALVALLVDRVTTSLLGVALPDALTVPAAIVLWVVACLGALRLIRFALRRLLWRIRTKLILSYLFVAVVPLVLLLMFFAVAAVLTSGVVASSMVTAAVERHVEDLGRFAQSALGGLAADATPSAADVERALAPAKAVFPRLEHIFVRDGHIVSAAGTVPGALPAWIKGGSFSGLVKDGEENTLRAVAARPGTWLVLDVPLDPALFADLEKRAGIRVLAMGGSVRMVGGGVNIEFKDDRKGPDGTEVEGPPPPPQQVTGLPFVAMPDQTGWKAGETEAMPLAFQYDAMKLLRRLTPGTLNFAELLVRALAVLGGVFLVMYGMALVVGLLLARSITRSVHALSRGTERLRQGRFDQPIPVKSRDQLGELAESFNLMSRDIKQLMLESAEKERLEEELRIARRIQMSLLPQGTVTSPHVTISAICIPAAEVGGDYYDLLPLAGDRLAVLVADVSGKGTSAALYMAELKGLMLSLSRVHDSPATLLAEANRILAGDMDARSFITITYAVLEPRERRMRFARAGHSPLIHRAAATGATRVLAPPGLGVGLDPGPRFESVLEEMEVPLQGGDLFLFFTDGISEAMNEKGELFGEDRLRQLLERDGAGGSEDVRERILAEVGRFVGMAPQHDDMTMVVLRID